MENIDYIDNYEYNNKKCNLSEYYIKITKDMINQLINSEPGKRIWELNKKNNGWTYDYTLTKRSSYPDWAKFAFRRSIYKKKLGKNDNINNLHITKSGNILVEKNYGLSGKELIYLLHKSIIKPLTERQGEIIEEAFGNFIDYINEYEYLYKTKYFNDEIIVYYDDFGNIIGAGKRD